MSNDQSGWQQRIAVMKRYKSGAYGAMVEDEDGKWVLLECVKDAIAVDRAEPACGEDHLIGSRPDDCFACLSEQRDELLAALKAVTQPDVDCPRCDRGRLRDPQKPHWPECPFGRASVLIAAVEGQNAKDALPPSSSDTFQRVLAEREACVRYIESCREERDTVQVYDVMARHIREARHITDVAEALPPVSEASPVKPDRFAELLELPENWDSYGAAKVDPRAVEAARRFQEALTAAPQSVVPICTGGVQIEMHRCGFDFEVSFHADGTIEEAYAADAVTQVAVDPVAETPPQPVPNLMEALRKGLENALNSEADASPAKGVPPENWDDLCMIPEPDADAKETR